MDTKKSKVYYPPTKSELEKGLRLNYEYPAGHPKRTGDIGNITRYITPDKP